MNKPSVFYFSNWFLGEIFEYVRVLINHLGVLSSILGSFENFGLCKEIKCIESNAKPLNQ